MSLRRSVAAVFLSLWLALPGLAAEPAPLRDETIRDFIASLPVVTRWGKAMGQDVLATATEPQEEGMPSSPGVLAGVYGAKAYDTLGQIVARYGFASPEAWAAVAQRVMRAYLATEAGGRTTQIEAQLAEAQRRITDNPDLTPGQKSQLLALLQQGQAWAGGLADVPEADKAAIARHRPALADALGAL